MSFEPLVDIIDLAQFTSGDSAEDLTSFEYDGDFDHVGYHVSYQLVDESNNNYIGDFSIGGHANEEDDYSHSYANG